MKHNIGRFKDIELWESINDMLHEDEKAVAQ